MGRGRGFLSLWGCMGASWLSGGIPAGLLQGWGQRGDSPTCGGLAPCPAAPALLHRRHRSGSIVPPEVRGAWLGVSLLVLCGLGGAVPGPASLAALSGLGGD